jgi:pimeloyl-ACP methyl ester carboxylesterase
VDADGVRLYYRDAGTNPVLVLIQGASIFEPLSQTRPVIAIDSAGHGYSERPGSAWLYPEPMHRLLQQLGVMESTNVGHSWSGPLVLIYLPARQRVRLVPCCWPVQPIPEAWYNALAGVPLRWEDLPLRKSIGGGAVGSCVLECPFPRSAATARALIFKEL